MWIVSTACPVSRRASSIAARWASARESITQRTVWARVSGTGLPVRRQKSAMRPGMSPGAWKIGSSASTTDRNGTSPAACLSSSSRSTGPPRAPAGESPASPEAPPAGSSGDPVNDPVNDPVDGSVPGGVSAGAASASQVRMHSCSSHNPVTLRR